MISLPFLEASGSVREEVETPRPPLIGRQVGDRDLDMALASRWVLVVTTHRVPPHHRGEMSLHPG